MVRLAIIVVEHKIVNDWIYVLIFEERRIERKELYISNHAIFSLHLLND